MDEDHLRERYQEVIVALERRDLALAHEVMQDGGIRGLFDPFCAEYGSRSKTEKVEMTRRLLRALSFDDVACLAEFSIVGHGYERTYALHTALGGALRLLAE